MDRKKKIVTMIVAMAMVCMTTMTALADSHYNVHISLAENQVWTSGYAVTRSTQYGFVSASLDSVYPSTGTDNYEKIQARVSRYQSGTSIMTTEYVTLKEGDGFQELRIKDGYLSLTTVYVQFRGNTSKSAEAVVNYKGN